MKVGLLVNLFMITSTPEIHKTRCAHLLGGGSTSLSSGLPAHGMTAAGPGRVRRHAGGGAVYLILVFPFLIPLQYQMAIVGACAALIS